VIIYDRLEAPTLWIEANKDKADSARVRIIPAEHVRAIIEVKSAFNRRNVNSAIRKLRELAPLTEAIDKPDERYPRYLQATAILFMLFFELRGADRNDPRPLDILRDFDPPRAFYGAVILRGDTLDADDVGIVTQTISDSPMAKLVTEKGLLGLALAASVPDQSDHHRGAMLMWNDVNFARFAFDLVAILNGTFRSGFASSFHGLDFTQFGVRPSTSKRGRKTGRTRSPNRSGN
jgi:hypothetical protein